MKRFISLLKYNLIKLYKSKVIIAAIAIVVLGLIMNSKAVFDNTQHIYFINIVNYSWIITSVCTFPLLILGIVLGNEDDVLIKFNTNSIFAKYLSKIIALVSFAIISLAIITVFLGYFMVFYFNQPMEYYVYYIKEIYILFTISALIYSNIGLFLGMTIGKFLRGLPAYTISAGIFVLTAGFGRSGGGNYIFINNMVQMPSYFESMIKNNYFKSGIIIWTLILIPLVILVVSSIMVSMRKKYKFVAMGMAILLCGMFITKWANCTVYYPTIINSDNQNLSVNDNEIEILEYKMDVKLNEDFYNDCNMKFSLNNEKEIELDFFRGFNIDEITINGSPAEYSRGLDKLIIKDIKGNSGEVLNLNIKYGGYVFTCTNIFAVENYTSDDSSFLSGKFGWYPKTNSNSIKKFNVEVSSQNDIYSNLDAIKSNDRFNINGETEELCLVTSKWIDEVDYNGIKIIGQVEFVNNVNTLKWIDLIRTDELLNEEISYEGVKKIILVPFVFSAPVQRYGDVVILGVA